MRSVHNEENKINSVNKIVKYEQNYYGIDSENMSENRGICFNNFVCYLKVYWYFRHINHEVLRLFSESSLALSQTRPYNYSIIKSLASN